MSLKNGNKSSEQKWRMAKNRADVAYFKAVLSICFGKLTTIVKSLRWVLSEAVSCFGRHHWDCVFLFEHMFKFQI